MSTEETRIGRRGQPTREKNQNPKANNTSSSGATVPTSVPESDTSPEDCEVLAAYTAVFRPVMSHTIGLECLCQGSHRLTHSWQCLAEFSLQISFHPARIDGGKF